MFKDKYNELQSSIHPESQLIEKTIAKCKNKNQNNKGEQIMKFNFKKISVSIAACVLVFVSVVNISPTFAATMEDIPILGSFVKIISVRSYIEDNDDYTTTVKQPVVNESGVIDVNIAIEKAVEDYKESAKLSIQDYKDAFIATGGTEEEFKAKDIQVNVNYEIKSNTNKYTSFVLEMYENWLASSASYEYYNLDSSTGKKITLQDLLGEDYINISNQAIQSKISETESDNLYFPKGDGGFETINENTNFYINENGNPVIVFEKYEIAPGSTGMPEFEIAVQ